MVKNIYHWCCMVQFESVFERLGCWRSTTKAFRDQNPSLSKREWQWIHLTWLTFRPSVHWASYVLWKRRTFWLGTWRPVSSRTSRRPCPFCAQQLLDPTPEKWTGWKISVALRQISSAACISVTRGLSSTDEVSKSLLRSTAYAPWPHFIYQGSFYTWVSLMIQRTVIKFTHPQLLICRYYSAGLSPNRNRCQASLCAAEVAHRGGMVHDIGPWGPFSDQWICASFLVPRCQFLVLYRRLWCSRLKSSESHVKSLEEIDRREMCGWRTTKTHYELSKCWPSHHGNWSRLIWYYLNWLRYCQKICIGIWLMITFFFLPYFLKKVFGRVGGLNVPNGGLLPVDWVRIGPDWLWVKFFVAGTAGQRQKRMSKMCGCRARRLGFHQFLKRNTCFKTTCLLSWCISRGFAHANYSWTKARSRSLTCDGFGRLGKICTFARNLLPAPRAPPPHFWMMNVIWMDSSRATREL